MPPTKPVGTLATCTLLFLSLLFAACGGRTPEAVSPTATEISTTPTVPAAPSETPASTSTSTPQPSPTPTQTATPLPTAEPITAGNILQVRELEILARGPILDMELSPDGSTLAAASFAGIWLYDSQSFELTKFIKTEDARLSSVAWSPDGSTLAAGAEDGAIRLWEVSTAVLSGVLVAHQDYARISTIAWSPDGSKLASGGSDFKVWVWDAASQKPLLELAEDETRMVYSLSWSPDSSRLVSSGVDPLVVGDKVYTTIRVWDATNGENILVLDQHESQVNGVAWSPDGNLIATVSRDDTLRLWDATSGEQLHILECIQHGSREMVTFRIAWAPDGKRLASACSSTVTTFDIDDPENSTNLPDFEEQINQVAWSQDGESLIIADNHQVSFWDLSEGQVLERLTGHDASLGYSLSMAWSPGARWLGSLNGDNTLSIWQRNGWQSHHQSASDLYTIGLSTLKTLGWFQDSSQMYLIDYGGNTGFWSTQEHTLVESPFILEVPDLGSIVWSPDGNRLASGGRDWIVRIWDAANGAQLEELQAHWGEVWHLAWSPGGSTLATAGFDGTLILWNTATWEIINSWELGREIEGLSQGTSVQAMAWSPDGRFLATSLRNDPTLIWDIAEQKVLQKIDLQPGRVLNLTWSPDSTLLGAAIEDQGIRIWDLEGHELLSITAHAGPVSGVAWSPDGALLATSGLDGTIRIWGLP